MLAFRGYILCACGERDMRESANGENNKHHRCNAKEKQQNQTNPNGLQQQDHSCIVSNYQAYPLN